MFPWPRSKKSEEPVPENIDVELKNGSLDVEKDDDGIFVTETGRKRRTSVAKVLTYAAIGLAIAGTAFGTGYGVNVAVQRSRVSPSTIGVEEQLPQVETSWPTYAPTTAVEEAVVTPTPSPEPTPGPTPEPTEAIAEEEATEPAGLEGEDMSMPQIEEEELATIDELFLDMSMRDKGVELSMDYGANGHNGNGGKSGKMKKSKKGTIAPRPPTPPRPTPKSGKSAKQTRSPSAGKSAKV
mmetsp:Transcript_32580/g.74405  ORF Transcript_32580/g.74405 Transcript_32580/m.74405 type:complete len:239 (+) Transcript_32580:144-860(+)